MVVGGVLFAQQTFTTFQKASLVIGQPDFVSDYNNTSDTITYGPDYSAISCQNMLAVSEQTGHKVKIWKTIPDTNGAPADVTIDLPNSTYGVGWSPDGNKLVVSCSDSIFIWNSVPLQEDQKPDVKLYYSSGNDFTGVLVTPKGKLLVGTYNSNRILVWNSVPDTSFTEPDFAIGQPDLTTTTLGNGAGDLYMPWGLNISPDGKLLIADQGNHRVVIYDSVPETFGDTAQVVIGQTDFNSSSYSCTDSTFHWPLGVTITPEGQVAVADYYNSRVLIFDSVPESNNAKASVILGQPDGTTGTQFYPSGTPDTNNMYHPYNVSSDLNGRFYVCGRDMNRVMVFGELPSDSADLSIRIQSEIDALCDSSFVAYKMVLKNLGGDTATGVVANAAFPEGFIASDYEIEDGEYIEESGYWYISSIAPSDSLYMIISGWVDSSSHGDTITAYANIISSSAIDTNFANNGVNKKIFIKDASIPADAITVDQSSCLGEDVVLTANSSGTVYWYAEFNDVSPIGTGSSFTISGLTSDAVYYAEAVDECPSNNRVAENVTINPTYTDTTIASVNEGEAYTWNANDYSETGIYFDSLTTVEGCDSILVLNLTSISTTSGIENIDISSEIKVFPNPVTDNLNIALENACDEVTVKLTSISGQTVYSAVYGQTNSIQISTESLSPGIYILNIGVDGSWDTVKLIK